MPSFDRAIRPDDYDDCDDAMFTVPCFLLLTVIYQLFFSVFGSLAAVVTDSRRLVSVSGSFFSCRRPPSAEVARLFFLSLSPDFFSSVCCIAHYRLAFFCSFSFEVGLAYIRSCDFLSLFCTYIVSSGDVNIQNVIGVHQRMSVRA